MRNAGIGLTTKKAIFNYLVNKTFINSSVMSKSLTEIKKNFEDRFIL